MGTSVDVLSLPVATYLWVLGVAIIGGLVGVMNKTGPYRAWDFFKAALTSAFTGFMAFCACHEGGVSMGWTLFAVGVSGLMGKRAWDDMENILRLRLGVPPRAPDSASTSEAE